MLYEQGRYQDVIDVFQVIRSRQIQGGMYPRHVVLLVFAACYKEVNKIHCRSLMSKSEKLFFVSSSTEHP